MATPPSNGLKPSEIIKFLIDECGACPACASLLLLIDERDEYLGNRINGDGEDNNNKDDEDINDDNDHDDDNADDNDDGTSSLRSCTVCLGLLNPSYVRNVVLPIAAESLAPYLLLDGGGVGRRCRRGGSGGSGVGGGDRLLSRESPTVVVPRLVVVRAYCAIECARR